MTFQNSCTPSESSLTRYLSLETIFSLSHGVLTYAKIKILEKELDFAPIQRKINEPKHKHDFNEFCRRMRSKWYFRVEAQEITETTAFLTKTTQNLFSGHPCLEMFLSQFENKLFKIIKQELRYSNSSKEE